MDDKVTDARLEEYSARTCGCSMCVEYKSISMELIAFRRQAQEAPKAASQSAEALANALRECANGSDEQNTYELDDDQALALIESAFAAQRQIGREERQHEVDLAELEADRVKIEWEHDLERYAALEEAAREARAWIDGILCQCDTTVDHVCDRCVLIRSIDKALSALDDGRKG